MVNKGPAPMPTNIKILTGNRGKRPLNSAEPKPGVMIDKNPPDYLDELAAEKWRELVPELENIGVLTSADRVALEALCNAYSLYVQACQMVQKKGLITKGLNDIPYQNPYLKIVDNQSKIMKGYLQEFGLTPSARTRVKVNPPTEKSSKFDKI